VLQIIRIQANKRKFITEKAEFCQNEQKQQSPHTDLHGKLNFINVILSDIWDTRENTGRRSFRL